MIYDVESQARRFIQPSIRGEYGYWPCPVSSVLVKSVGRGGWPVGSGTWAGQPAGWGKAEPRRYTPASMVKRCVDVETLRFEFVLVGVV